MRLAAIDIGSNAVRLLINDITLYKDGSLEITKVNLVRIPLRLGFDVFEHGKITAQKQKELSETMVAFKHLMHIYKVQRYRVCATSAMRDATNSKHIVRQVKQETGLKIEVISGKEEATMLYETHLAEMLDTKNNYLYIDVGGGSTELTFYGKGKLLASQSFDIGTIRLLKHKISEEQWELMQSFIKETVKIGQQHAAIGSGGNINKIFSLSKRKPGKPLSLEILRTYYNDLSHLSVSDRMHTYGLKEDRADVIVPALHIYSQVMRWAGISKIYVPQIGLADGIIRKLYQEMSVTSLTQRSKLA